MIQCILNTLLWIFPLIVIAQIDTSIQMETIEITEYTINSAMEHGFQISIGGSRIKKLPQNEITVAIRRETSWFIRSYGISGIASLSAKGCGAAQNTVLWNGMPINNPMVGQIDLNLLSLNHFNSLHLTQSALTNTWGFGTIGAVIDLRYERPESVGNRWQLNTGASSFKNYDASYKLHNVLRKFQVTSSVNISQGKNNFPYSIGSSDKKITQEHSAHQLVEVQESYFLPVGKNQTCAFHYWLRRTHREIPPTTTQNVSEADQWDRHGRFMLAYKMDKSDYALDFSLAYSKEYLRFRDGISALDDTSHFERLYFESKIFKFLNANNKIDFGLRFSHDFATAPAYDQRHDETKLVFHLSFTRSIKNQMLKANASQQIIDFDRYQFIPALSYIRIWSSGIKANLVIQRNLRNPGLNDRYWIPGGNPELRSEYGWTEAFRLEYQKDKSAEGPALNISAEFYHRYIKDWILWAASDQGPLFYASNIAEVRSYGMEVSTGITSDGPYGIFNLQLTHHYVRSKNEHAIQLPNIEKGQQLYYVPKHQFKLHFNYTIEHWNLELFKQYIGSTIGINEVLPAYFTGDFYVNKYFSIRSIESKIGFYVQNFTNTNYRVIERRPMPGRNYGIRIILSNK